MRLRRSVMEVHGVEHSHIMLKSPVCLFVLPSLFLVDLLRLAVVTEGLIIVLQVIMHHPYLLLDFGKVKAILSYLFEYLLGLLEVV